MFYTREKALTPSWLLIFEKAAVNEGYSFGLTFHNKNLINFKENVFFNT